jgi:hypothetical protein
MQVPVPAMLIDEVEQLYAPPDHPVFQLVPQIFEQRIIHHYNSINRPVVNIDSFWDIYRQLLAAFHTQGQDNELATILTRHEETRRAIDEEAMPLLPGQRNLRFGVNVIGLHGETYRYSGGAVNPPLPDGWTLDGGEEQPDFADFTESDDD